MTVQINGTTGITTPALTSTAEIVSANGVGGSPCFSAYQSVAQTMPSNVYTKINFQTKEFDTTNAFDNVTNMRYTPLVAGYYQVTGAVSVQSAGTTIYLSIYKNGINFKTGPQISSTGESTIGCLIYMNGTTDYIELWAVVMLGQALLNAAYATYFQAALIRGA